MDPLKELREKHTKLIDEAEGIVTKAKDEKRDLSKEEREQFDAKMADAEKLAAEIKDKEADEERRQKVQKQKADATKGQRRTTPQDPGDGSEPGAEPAFKPSPTFPLRRSGRLRSFDRYGRQEAERMAYRSGMFALATIFGDQRAAQWCTDNGIEIRAQVEGINKKGGFLVPTEMEQAIIDNRDEFGVFRANARVTPMGSDTLVVPVRNSGLTAYAVGENDEITESEKEWTNIELVARKWAVLTKYSSELSEDAVLAIADDIVQEMSYTFAVKEDDCGWNGDGTSAFHGIRGLVTKIDDGTHTASVHDAPSNINLFSEVTATHIANWRAKLPKWARSNARFYCSSAFFSSVFERLMAAAGGNTIDSSSGVVQERYLGTPVILDETLPSGTGDQAGNIVAFYGDLMRTARMGDRRGVTIMASDHRYFELDQVALRGTERFDIVCHSLGDTTNAGGIIALKLTA